MIDESSEDLGLLSELFETGAVRPVISEGFGFDEIPDALRRLGEGHTFGKLVAPLDAAGPADADLSQRRSASVRINHSAP